MLAKFALSAAVAGSMYSTSAPSTTSLWGISCNSEPASFTQKLINFGSFCSMQVLPRYKRMTNNGRNYFAYHQRLFRISDELDPCLSILEHESHEENGQAQQYDDRLVAYDAYS
jgi:hypothetical protein